jgi:hypothetical protein
MLTGGTSVVSRGNCERNRLRPHVTGHLFSASWRHGSIARSRIFFFFPVELLQYCDNWYHLILSLTSARYRC